MRLAPEEGPQSEINEGQEELACLQPMNESEKPLNLHTFKYCAFETQCQIGFDESVNQVTFNGKTYHDITNQCDQYTYSFIN